MNDLREYRLQLVEARAQLRAAKDTHELAKAAAEHHAIASLNGNAGKNAEERERNLTIALSQDGEYQQVLTALRRIEYEVERLEATIEIAIDQRRAFEWDVRARLADALYAAYIQNDEPASDAGFDDAADLASFDSTHYARHRPQQILDEDMPF